MSFNKNFKIQDKNGNTIELCIKDPSLKEREEAESVRIQAWNRAIKSGAIFAEKLNDVLVEQGIWDSDKENKLMELRIEVADRLDHLEKGGIKLNDARNIALEVKDLRTKINVLTFDRLRYITNTVENIASDREFGCLTAHMVYNTNGTRYFKDYNDYLNRTQDIDVYQINNEVANIVYGGQNSLYPEVKFLKDYKFVNEELQFINKDGHLTDQEGRLINDKGQYIKYDDDKNPIVVDINGNKIEIIEKKPFLDENDVPIRLETDTKSETEPVVETVS